MTFTCTRCALEKPIGAFPKNPSRTNPDKRRTCCKACSNIAKVALYPGLSERTNKRRRANYKLRPQAAEQFNTSRREQHKADPRPALLRSAQRRAKAAGVPFGLTLGDLVVPTHCPVLGFPLSVGTRGRHDTAPSLDRIRPALGYVPGNIVVISYRANRLKNDGTIEEHLAVLRYMQEHQCKEHS